MQRLSRSAVRSHCLCLLLAYVLIFSLIGPLATTRAGAAPGSPAGNAKYKRETASGAVAPLPAVPQGGQREGELLVRFRAEVSEQDKASAVATHGGRNRRRLGGESGIEKIEVGAGQRVETVAAQLRLDPAVEFAEPNFLIERDDFGRASDAAGLLPRPAELSALGTLNPTAGAYPSGSNSSALDPSKGVLPGSLLQSQGIQPDDPRFSEQWALRNSGQNGGQFGSDIGVTTAWQSATGSQATVIAVIDSGIDFTHPDLANNKWTNAAPSAAGDLNGWDFITDSGSIIDEQGHGTAIAGIIAAQGNNGAGVTGVMWRAGLMSLRVLDNTGTGDVADAVEAIDYAVAHGAHVINISWGTLGESLALKDAIERALRRGVVVVCSAGNNGQDVDTTPYYPASFSIRNLIVVAASDNFDQLTPWSNWGDRNVTVAAPGIGVLTTQMGGGYWLATGTSAAAPLVSGVAGLLKSARPWVSERQVEKALSDGVRQVASLSRKVSAGGVVNAAGALQALPGAPGNRPQISPPGYGTGGTGPGGSFSTTPPPITTGAPGANLPNLDQMRNMAPQEPQPRQPIQSNLVCADCDPLDGGGGGSYHPAGDPDFSVARERPEDETGNPGVNGVDLGSRNFNWGQPLLSLPGRAGMDLNLTLYYNSLVWTKDGSYIKFNADKGNPAVGFRLGFPKVQRSFTNASGGQSFMLVTSSGGRVELRRIGSSNIYESLDGSYTQLDASTIAAPVVRTSDGTQLLFEQVTINNEYRCKEIKDRNGNKITATHNLTNGHLLSIIDTLGREVTFVYDGSNNLTAIRQTWAGSAHDWATFEYGQVYIAPGFSGLYINGANNNYVTVLTRVNLHDGSSYRFDYSTNFGQVKQINHHAPNNDILSYTSYNLNTSVGQTDCPRFTERRDWAQNWNNGNDAVTTYSAAGDNSWTKVTAPDGTVYKEWFYTTPAWKKGLTSETKHYETAAAEAADTWKKRSTIAWTQSDENLSYQKNPRVTETNIYDSDGNRKRVMIDYGPGNGPYVAYSLPYCVIEFAADGATVTRGTYTDYNLSSTYTDKRIIGLASFVHVVDFTAGIYVSKTSFDYDAGGSYMAGHSQATNHDGTNYGTGFVAGRGNLTAVTRWDVTDINNGAKAIAVRRIGYNITGSPAFMLDALNHQTTISYADSFSDGNNSRGTFAYPTTLTDADNYQATTQYKFEIGLVTKTLTPSKGTGGANPVYYLDLRITYDSVGRIERVDNQNNGAWKFWAYPTAGNAIQNRVTIKDGVDSYYSITVFDGAGRVRAEGGDLPNSTGTYHGRFTYYDVMGRVSQQSNPAEITAWWTPTGDDAAGWIWTTQSYDWQGRPLLTTLPYGNTRENTYGGCGCAGGEITTVRDERGRRRKLTKDVLGRLKQVDELNWDQSVYATTTYAYNARDQITSSNQAGQIRSFAYDGYGRLYQKTTPEQGTSTYSYFANDTIQTVTDARGATTTFAYNNRDLVTSITYGVPAGVAATSNVTFAYDAARNRTLMIDGIGFVEYVYNTLSQLTSESRYFNGLASYTLSYAYNLGGEVTSITNSFGAQVGYNYDGAGRPTGVSGTGYGGVTSYVNSISYRAFGMKQMAYANGKTLSLQYDNRMRPTQWSVPGVMRWDYSYTYFGENTGRVTYAKNLDDGTLDRSYDYDHVGRMWSAHTGKEARWHIGLEGYTGADGPYSQDRSYDQFGNPTLRVGWGGYQGGGFNYSYSFSNNKLVQNPATGAYLTYDAAGNLTNDGYQSASYDATGQQTYAGTLGLFQSYDGDRLRGKKTENGITTYYLRSSVLGGQIVAEITSAGGWQRGYVYLGGQMVAIQYGGVYWVHQDPITKSQRLTNSGGTVTSIVDLDPWGGETWRSSNPAYQPHEYTTYVRDSNGGDEAMHRRYQAYWNRFSQPDPYDGSYNLTDPQSLNRYAYVQNDPVNFVDPSGLNLEDPYDTVITTDTWGRYNPWGDVLFWRYMFWSPDVGTGGPTGGDFSGGPGESTPQDPNEPNPQQQRNPPCLDFVDQLVEKVFGAAWYMARGDVGNGMMLTANENPYEKFMPNGMNDPNGFKPTLTQYGQAGDVYRHILFFAGGTLSRLQPVLWKAERVDRQQAQAGRRESITELADDQAGRHVGSLMDQAFDKKLDRNGLRDALRKELCK